MERGQMYYKRGDERSRRKALAHFGRAMEYGADGADGAGGAGGAVLVSRLLSLPQELIDIIMKMVMDGADRAAAMAGTNKHVASLARGMRMRDQASYVEYNKEVDLSCARNLARKTTLEWLDFCARAAGQASSANGAVTALDALYGRAVRELDRWHELVPPRFHDLVDIANAKEDSEAKNIARSLLEVLVENERGRHADDVAALRAVVEGKRRYEPVTNVYTAVRHLIDAHGPAWIWDTRGVTELDEAFEDLASSRVIDARLWDTSNVTSMIRTFANCRGEVKGIERWNVGRVTTMREAFHKCNCNPDIGRWDTSNVRDMSYMFYGAWAFNRPIGHWDTSNVSNMSNMFNGASVFDQPVGHWSTSNVETMSYMFAGARAFNQDIGDWKTGKLKDMSYMFYGAREFNQDISGWDTSSVTSMREVFRGAIAFDKPLGRWTTNNVTSMQSMFHEALVFNQPIGNWVTSKVDNMHSMFRDARAFNRPVGEWDTSSVYDMDSMFRDARAFNQPIQKWKTGSVRNMRNMFQGASSFDQDISNWNVSRCSIAIGMFDGSGMKEQNKPTFSAAAMTS